MASGVWSETEPSVEIRTTDELDRFIEWAEARTSRPTAISVNAHGYRVDLLVGHDTSFVHLTPDDPCKPHYVSTGAPAKGGVDFWLHSWHHTWFEGCHLVPKAYAREAFREFFQFGTLAPVIEWEQYTA
jgi:hypothetical protein